jgi:hypothetical protein
MAATHEVPERREGEQPTRQNGGVFNAAVRIFT